MRSEWWDVKTLKCSCCQKEAAMRDMTIHFEEPERFLWCTYCGAVCRPNVGDPISLHDWYACEVCAPTGNPRHPVTGRMN